MHLEGDVPETGTQKWAQQRKAALAVGLASSIWTGGWTWHRSAVWKVRPGTKNRWARHRKASQEDGLGDGWGTGVTLEASRRCWIHESSVLEACRRRQIHEKNVLDIFGRHLMNHCIALRRT